MVSSSVSEFLSKYFVCNYFLLMTVDVLLVWCGLAVIAKFELLSSTYKCNFLGADNKQ